MRRLVLLGAGGHASDLLSVVEAMRNAVGTDASDVLMPIAIGDGAVIGAGSVVVRDVPPGVTVAGVPAGSGLEDSGEIRTRPTQVLP